MWTEYVIDATMGVRNGLLCFCPVERGPDGEIDNVVTGMSYLSDGPPHDGKLIAVIHKDGRPAVEEWCEQNKGLLDNLFASDSDGSPKGEDAPCPECGGLGTFHRHPCSTYAARLHAEHDSAGREAASPSPKSVQP